LNRRLPAAAIALVVLLTALIAAALAASPASAWPNKVQDCAGCHDQYPGGVLGATPSAAYPAPGGSYSVAVTIPQNTAGTFGTGYWVANSTAAGATGSSTDVYGGSASGAIVTGQTYAPAMTAPLADGVYYYKVFGQDGTSSKGMTSSSLYSITVDATAPSTTSGNDAAWHAAPLSFSLSPSDATSGISATYWSRLGRTTVHSGTTVTLDGSEGKLLDGAQTIVYWSVDRAGNVEGTKTATVYVDTAAPRTVDDSDGRVHPGSATIHLSATDYASGVAQTYYSVDGGSFTSGSNVVVGTPGTHYVWYYSVDAVGNVEPTRVTWAVVTAASPARSSSSRILPTIQHAK
jgi:hypothetical protein